jgi:hypothetical protein
MQLFRYKKCSILIFFLFVIVLASAQQIAVNNQIPRLNIKGNMLYAYDGRIIQFGKLFYWHRTKYRNKNGLIMLLH